MYQSKNVSLGDGGEQAAAGSSSTERPTHMDVYEELFCPSASLKASIVAHPLYDKLLAAHVACLRVATPAEQHHNIDSGLANCHHIAWKYLASAGHQSHVGASSEDNEELSQFMVNYILLLQSFKQKLQEHLSTQFSEAISACWEIEQALYNLTGVSISAGNESVMPEDDKDFDNDLMSYNASRRIGIDAFLPCDIEKSFLEHIRRELKKELKKDYRSKLKDVRDEILRKRRVGKLPGDTAHILKNWWAAHADWPYPTEEEKIQLVEETGLELKQINNWFINQRKRNWQAQNNNMHTISSGEVGEEGNMETSNPLNMSLSLNDDIDESSHQ